MELVDARANVILWSSNYVISAPANLELVMKALVVLQQYCISRAFSSRRSPKC